MTDTITELFPDGEAEVTYPEAARRILDAIQAAPDAFDMSAWYSHKDGLDLRPVLLATQPVDCGTTMCGAGWAAHHAGYDLDWLGFRRTGSSWGDYDVRHHRTGEYESVITVAERVLGIGPRTDIWYGTNGEMLAALRALSVAPDDWTERQRTNLVHDVLSVSQAAAA
jgi:hypothetical protein